MLKKSIDLHLKMVIKEIRGSAVVIFIFGLMFLFSPVLFVLGAFIPLIILSIFLIKGTSKLYGRSLYGTESELYHSLPLTTREILLGKAVVMVVWQAVLMVILLAMAIAAYLTENNTMNSDIFERLVDGFLEQGMTPVQMGILISFIFVGLLISEAAYCMFLVASQIIIRSIAPGIATKMSDVVSVIVAGLLFSGITFGVRALAGLISVPDGLMFYILIGKYLLLAGIATILYYYCRDNMEKAFDTRYRI